MPSHDDEYLTLAMKSCAILAEVEDSAFLFSGFGRADWKLDVGYDMSTFVEAVPDLIAGLLDSRYVEVELYSQGVERILGFWSVGTGVHIDCQSQWNDYTDPGPEVMARAELLQMLY